jgi:hypothetical protein
MGHLETLNDILEGYAGSAAGNHGGQVQELFGF